MATHDEEDHVGDIEKQLLRQDGSSSSSTILFPPLSKQKVITNVEKDNHNKADVEVAESVVNTPTTTTTSTPTSSVCDTIIEVVMYSFMAAIYFLVLFPLFVVFLIGSICITGDYQTSECFSKKKESADQKPSPKQAIQKGIYRKMLAFESTKMKFKRLNLATTTRIGCLALLWLVVNLSVPSLKSVALFEYPLWKWSLLVVVIFLGFPLTKIATVLLLFSLNDFAGSENFDYVLIELENSLTPLLHFMVILVMWLSYFRTDHGLHPSKTVEKFGTWAFVSLLVGEILWVLKSATLLKWKLNAVHKRFKGRILTAGFQLYFLTLIINGFRLEQLLPWRGIEKQDKETSKVIVSDEVAKDRKNLRIQDYIISKHVSLGQINSVAKFVTDLANVTQRENDGIPEIVEKYQEKIPTLDDGGTDHRAQYITEKALKDNFGLDEDDAQLLLQELKVQQVMSDEITYDTLQKWMVDAHKNCLSVGYTLIDAFAVVGVLNRVIIGFIFVVVIFLWLFITGLATTQVLVLIASPFLALSFVFGDTCKIFCQGIIFSFVTHPYDVGDRCIIEGIQSQLEVKRIGILTTTFLKIGAKEKMIYPNGSLATKLITNLEGEPDPSDTIELILDSSTTKLKILGLRRDLESFFESSDRHGFYEETIHVAVKEIKNNIKVSISFTHVMNVHDVSHSQCLQKKNKQRSELLINVKQFLEDQEIKLASAP